MFHHRPECSHGTNRLTGVVQTQLVTNGQLSNRGRDEGLSHFAPYTREKVVLCTGISLLRLKWIVINKSCSRVYCGQSFIYIRTHRVSVTFTGPVLVSNHRRWTYVTFCQISRLRRRILYMLQARIIQSVRHYRT